LPAKVISCGILRPELEYLLQGRNVEMEYLDAALHVDFDRLSAALTGALKNSAGDNPVLVIGTDCHPDMAGMTAAYGGRLVRARNCIEMLLGPRMAELDARSRTFYLTGGWLENWRNIFVDGLHWDNIDARQNFGRYDRILLLDTGLARIDEAQILEFFDYTRVPVEILPTGLDHLRQLLADSCRY